MSQAESATNLKKQKGTHPHEGTTPKDYWKYISNYISNYSEDKLNQVGTSIVVNHRLNNEELAYLDPHPQQEQRPSEEPSSQEADHQKAECQEVDSQDDDQEVEHQAEDCQVEDWQAEECQVEDHQEEEYLEEDCQEYKHHHKQRPRIPSISMEIKRKLKGITQDQAQINIIYGKLPEYLQEKIEFTPPFPITMEELVKKIQELN
ncbi:hypothetical protein C8Q80DRAFT_1116606 [Daedaleopsis nitida]|nr:hypothetical protein C8Q80DRAFT_1116606 [Daedaleopsis nitida]